MKNERQNAILDIIRDNNIETQEDLIAKLRSEGFDVTQATVSRDIRELKITKITSDGGKYKYTAPIQNESEGNYAYSNAIAASLLSVESSMNLIVIHTYPGMAQGVAAALDNIDIPGIMGCVAGDDTILAAVRTPEQAIKAVAEIRKIASR